MTQANLTQQQASSIANAQRVQGSEKWIARFFTIWIGQALSLLGSQTAGFALIWWMTETTGSATVLAVGALIDTLPRIFVGPLAGMLIDRWDRRRIMIVADSIAALMAAVLVYLSWANLLHVWHLYALGVIRAICGVFHWVAMQSSTSLMVPGEHLARVQGLNQILNGVMNIAGPALGALLIGILPLHGALSIDLLTALLAILPLSFIAIPQLSREAAPAQASNPSMGKEMVAGLRYIWNWSGLRTVLTIAVFCNLVGMPPMVLIPILVTKHFGGGAAAVASLQVAWPIGLVLGGLLLGIWGGFRRKTTSMVFGMTLSSVGIALVGLAPGSAIWLAWIGMLTAGLVNTFVNGPLIALLQTVVNPDMQGRVMATLVSLANAMTPLGLAIAGPLADRVGIRPMYVIAGSVFLLAGVTMGLSPAVKQLENGHKSPSPVDQADLAQDLQI